VPGNGSSFRVLWLNAFWRARTFAIATLVTEMPELSAGTGDSKLRGEVPTQSSDRIFSADDDVAKSMGRFACAYAALGWPVLPLHNPLTEEGCTCGRNCGGSCGKHPRTRHGLADATIDLDWVRGWWHTWTDANIGIATGAKSGLFVLDVDEVTGGRVALEALIASHGDLPKSPTVITGGFGLHLYFRHPGQYVANSTGKVGSGLDVRGDGGYVVAPPSLHRSGHRYAWKADRHPDRVTLAEAPAWLLAMIFTPTPRARPEHPPGDGERIGVGRRNSVMTSLAGSMRRRGFSEDAILAALLAENAVRCAPPLTEAELAKIARSVSRYAPAAPPSGSTWRGVRVREARRA
jgi:putative DNA primase/helicase